MLVSRVGVKLDESHLLLKLAVLTEGTKRNTVLRVTLSSLQPTIPPVVTVVKFPLATGSGNFTTVQLQL